MYKVKFIRNEEVFKNCSRYLGKRMIMQRDFLEWEAKWGRKRKLEILATIYKDLGFGDIVIEKIKENTMNKEYYKKECLD